MKADAVHNKKTNAVSFFSLFLSSGQNFQFWETFSLPDRPSLHSERKIQISWPILCTWESSLTYYPQCHLSNNCRARPCAHWRPLQWGGGTVCLGAVGSYFVGSALFCSFSSTLNFVLHFLSCLRVKESKWIFFIDKLVWRWKTKTNDD